MYEFRSYSERIWNMREKVRNAVIVADSEKARIRLEASAKFDGLTPLIQKPSQSLYIISKIPLRIEEGRFLRR